MTDRECLMQLIKSLNMKKVRGRLDWGQYKTLRGEVILDLGTGVFVGDLVFGFDEFGKILNYTTRGA